MLAPTYMVMFLFVHFPTGTVAGVVKYSLFDKVHKRCMLSSQTCLVFVLSLCHEVSFVCLAFIILFLLPILAVFILQRTSWHFIQYHIFKQ